MHLSNVLLNHTSFVSAKRKIGKKLVFFFFSKNNTDALDTGNNAVLAFVQLWLVGANVAPYIPQPQARLTAELQGRQKKSQMNKD